jgi:formyltetrahydrofolate deformylase
MNKNHVVLLLHCSDQQGIVLAVSKFITSHNGNIVELDQYTDLENQHFFMRVKWDLEQFDLSKEKLIEQFNKEIGERFNMFSKIYYCEKPRRAALFVTKLSHCLYDILQRYQSNEWEIEIPLIISNHEKLRYIAEQFDIPYYVFPITKENKLEQEAKELALLKEHKIDFIVLARYMQVLTDDFIAHYPSRIINIHHSSLPAFPGAKPYHSAFRRGVKIIGATSHYVTAELDAGPIIAQDVTKITHTDSIADLIRKGRDLEKTVLSEAIWLKLQHKILSYKNKTLVFR